MNQPREIVEILVVEERRGNVQARFSVSISAPGWNFGSPTPRSGLFAWLEDTLPRKRPVQCKLHTL